MMLELYFAPRTRAVRVAWLLEELQLPYRLRPVVFRPTAERFFAQDTPTGKLPTLVDGERTLCESGAIVEYLLERYGAGRLAPAIGSPQRGEFLQWLHYAESTAFPPLGILAWLTIYRSDAEQHGGLIEDTRARAGAALDFVAQRLGERTYLLGEEFSAADIMMGFTLAAAAAFGVLDQRRPTLQAYLGRLVQRPAFQKVQSLT